MDKNKMNNISYTLPVGDLAIQSNTEDLTCIICMNICFKPVILTCCDRLICLECMKMMIKLSTKIKCPYCNNVYMNFQKPSKLICRIYENLTFICPKRSEGCMEIIKYHFYFDHIHNQCQYKDQVLGYCKQCQIVYTKFKEFEHNCEEYNKLKIEEINNQEITEIEKRLNEIYSNITGTNSGNNSKDSSTKSVLPKGTINIPRLHNHNLVLTNNRINVEYEQGWLCELCSDNIRNPTTKSYHCEACLYDICEKCYIYVSTRVPNSGCHNHELNLEIREIEWQCNACGKSYYRRRSWYCDLCEFDICVYCFWK